MRNTLTLCILAILHSARCGRYSNYAPVRRFHPSTAFSSNSGQEELETAENIQYAYEGGESSAGGEDFTHGQPMDFNHHDHGHTGEEALTHGHVGEVDLTNGHNGEVDLTNDHSAILDPSQPGFDHDHGSSGPAHTDLTAAEDHPVETLLTSHDHGYDYHGFDHGGYHYDHGYEYLPPSGHHVIESLPVLTTPPPPPSPAQAAKQSPSFTYYYLGRHLWYIPLYFSIYFIIYVGALVLKSVARHKILFPENLKAAAAAQARNLRMLEEGTKKFYM